MDLSGDYTDASMKQIEDAIETACEVITGTDYTISDVQAVTALLEDAISKAVKKSPTLITVSDVRAVYNGEPVTVPEPEVSGSTGDISYKYYADAEGEVELEGSPTDAGEYFYKAFAAADADYAKAESTMARLIVEKARSEIVKISPVYKQIKAGKSFTLKAVVSGSKTAPVTFRKLFGTKKITVNKTGKVIVKKSLKRGKIYKIKVRAEVAETKNYKSASLVRQVRIKVA